ncbi:MAG: PLP-dependent aminotransferase family protein [Bryobacter sp.]|nr:PLP-dependent aminotransferase family protein [Bryobacter sp.]
MVQLPAIDEGSNVPIYRQLYEAMKDAIVRGELRPGDRVAPTRELAAELGLNRATVSAAYELLEADGLIAGQVGRGSFVQAREISFATSRPAEGLFPLEDFREAAEEVIRSKASQILQLGSPQGYGPLREFLVEEAIEEGVFDPVDDDLLVTSGCQQALDLIARTLVKQGERVLVEEPVYPGLRNAFQGCLTSTEGQPGIKAQILTPTFSNPLGRTMAMEERKASVAQAEASGRMLVEVDVYTRLRYRGKALPGLRQLGARQQTLLLRSYSKMAFPGLRVGWVIGPKEWVKQLGRTKQWTDLHSDQLSQAIMLEFARSGRLNKHLENVLTAGRASLEATVSGLQENLPQGAKFTKPEGGMNLWVTLPAAMDAEGMLEEARRAGVNYLPGRHFELEKKFRDAFRISFAGLEPGRIREGLRRLGAVFAEKSATRTEPWPETVMV